MNQPSRLSSEILGRISLLQSFVAQLPDAVSMLKFVCQGLRDVTGVARVEYRIAGEENAQGFNDVTAALPDNCRHFPIRHKTTRHADLFFTIADTDAFAPYIPFIENFSNMLGVIFEEHRQRKLNQSILTELEQRVRERTAALELEINERRNAMEALRREKVFTDAALDALVDTFFLFDPASGRALRWNRSFREISGRSDAEIAVLPFPESYYERHDLEQIQTLIKNLHRQGRGTVELGLIDKDGQKIPTEYNVSVFGSDRDKTQYIILIGRNIAARKRMAEALVNSETRLRTLVDTIPDLVWLKDEHGVYLKCNPMFERFFGAKESDIIGKTDYDFVDEELADFFRDNDRKAMESGLPRINEEALKFAGDNYHGLFETIKTPMRDANGDFVGVLGIARDISARKKAEDELRKNEQRYKSAQRMGLVGNWEFDLSTEQFWGSDQAKRIYGFNHGIGIATTEDVESCIPEREKVHQALVDLIERNKPYDLEFEIQPANGLPKKMIRSIAEVVRNENGTPQKVAGVVQDITSQKKAENEKIDLERQLKQSQKMEAIGNLAGGIAHDFNNILSVIIGYAEMARDDVQNDPAIINDLDNILEAGFRARDLVKHILAFSRQAEVTSVPLQLATLVNKNLKMLRASIPTTIDIQAALDPDCGIVHADPTQVSQVLINLCSNAAHAMEGQSGVLRVELKNAFKKEGDLHFPVNMNPGSYAELAVSDTGIGIGPGAFDKIFDPYFTTKEVGKGTGMGLAIIHGILTGYGGAVSVESEPGKGTTFRAYFPIVSEQAPSHDEKRATLSHGKERILFVDDEAMLAEMGKSMLERLGYNVTVRQSSVDALSTFQNEPGAFDIVITDQTMPGMTGTDLARRMLQIRPDIPIILCTGYSNLVDENSVEALGIRGFAMKPFSMDQIASLIRTILDAP